MQVLLLSMSAHITEQLGMAPGGEFRTAFHEVCTLGGGGDSEQPSMRCVPQGGIQNSLP